MNFIRLNLYPFLLTLLLLAGALLALRIPVLRDAWWKSVPLASAWLWGLSRTPVIYGNYGYKLKTFEKMVAKGRRAYDPRYFVPYMGSPCMRSVVYFSLCEIGKSDDYKDIKRRFHAACQKQKPAKVVKLVYSDRIQYLAVDPATCEEYEI